MTSYNGRQQVFIVRNSWGGGGGRDGYCYAGSDYVGSKDFNVCQMYAIVGFVYADFTPDCDDGDDFENPADDSDEVQIDRRQYVLSPKPLNPKPQNS